MKARYWSLAIVLLLINYLIFSTLFSRLLEGDFEAGYATRTPIPTFTPAPAQPFIIVPTLTPAPIVPTPTATRVLGNGQNESSSSGATHADSQAQTGQSASQPQLTTPGSINIRSGPGLDFDIIGTLNANTTVTVVGRNPDTSWWQIKITEDQLGWVSSTVVSPSNTDSVPIVEAPISAVAPAAAPAQPAASNAPPAPTPPKHQFTPTGWYDDGNQGVTRFLGDIKDTNGNPVNGVFVQANCGHYSIISFPSGPTGWGTLNESADWPPGFYDITVDEKPIPCIWVLQVVDTNNRDHVKAILSEAIPVEVTQEKSVIVASWQKNW